MTAADTAVRSTTFLTRNLFSKKGFTEAWEVIESTLFTKEGLKDAWAGAGKTGEAVMSGKLLGLAGVIDSGQNIYKAVASKNPIKFLWHLIKPDQLLNILGILCLVPGFHGLMIPVAIGYGIRAIWDIMNGNLLAGIMTGACALPVGPLFKNWNVLREGAYCFVPASLKGGLKKLGERLASQIGKLGKLQGKLTGELCAVETSIVKEAKAAGAILEGQEKTLLDLAKEKPQEFGKQFASQEQKLITDTGTNLEEHVTRAKTLKPTPEQQTAIETTAKAAGENAQKQAVEQGVKREVEEAKQRAINLGRSEREIQQEMKLAEECAKKDGTEVYKKIQDEAEEKAKKAYKDTFDAEINKLRQNALRTANAKKKAFEELVAKRKELSESIAHAEASKKGLELSKKNIDDLLLKDKCLGELEGTELLDALIRNEQFREEAARYGMRPAQYLKCYLQTFEEVKFSKSAFMDGTLNKAYGEEVKNEFYSWFNGADLQNAGIGEKFYTIFLRKPASAICRLFQRLKGDVKADLAAARSATSGLKDTFVHCGEVGIAY